MAVNSSSSVSSRYLESSTNEVQKSQRKLSSGKKVEKGSDDAAGLAVIAALESDAATLEVANRNIEDGESRNEIADSTLSGLSDITNRMSELAMQSANGTYNDEQRAQMKAEYDALAEEAQRSVETSKFNGQNVLSAGETDIQVGTDGSSNSRISIDNSDISGTISKLSSVDIGTQAGAVAGLDTVSKATEEISSARGEIGASESRLEVASSNNSTMKVEEEAASSRIRDADVAEESANYVASSIRQNAGVAMMAQSNQSANIVQQLVG